MRLNNQKNNYTTTQQQHTTTTTTTAAAAAVALSENTRVLHEQVYACNWPSSMRVCIVCFETTPDMTDGVVAVGSSI